MNKFQGLIAALLLLALTSVQGSSGDVNYECIFGEGPTGTLIRRTTTTVTVVEDFAPCDCSQETPSPPETTTPEEPPHTPTVITTTEEPPRTPTVTMTTEETTRTPTVTMTTEDLPGSSATEESTTHSWNNTDTTTREVDSTEQVPVDLEAFCAAAGTGYYTLPNDPTCQGYLYCSSSGPIVKNCGSDLYFNEERQTCSSKKPETCTA